MRLGLINQLHGGGDGTGPTWQSILDRARTAEEVGFDIFVFEDALLYRDEEKTDGVWESMTIAAALAASTDTMRLGQSVVNSPYRSPALLASMATTLDEISGGRYVLGLGAGNTPGSDYEAFGFPTDRRFSRFAEAMEIVHSLLKTGKADFHGDFYEVVDSELVLRGPNATGPEINVAAGADRMLGLVARFADAWNWWGWDETVDQIRERVGPIIAKLDEACAAIGRDPDSLGRTFDVYGVLAPGTTVDHPLANPITGSVEEIAETLLELGSLGFEEVRCDVFPKSIGGIEAMAPVIELVRLG